MPKLKYDWKTIDPFLGKDIDSSISAIFHIPIASITDRRRKLRIPAFTKPYAKPNWKKIDMCLGIDTDINIGRRFGLGVSTISRRRRALNIPSFCQTKLTNKPRKNINYKKVIDSLVFNGVSIQELKNYLNQKELELQVKYLEKELKDLRDKEPVKTLYF